MKIIDFAMKSFSWVVSIFFTTMAIYAFSGGGVVAGSLFAIGALLSAPIKTLKELKSKVKIGRVLTIALTGVILVVGSITAPDISPSDDKSIPDVQMAIVDTINPALPDPDTSSAQNDTTENTTTSAPDTGASFDAPVVILPATDPASTLPEHQHSYVEKLVKSATCAETGLTTWACNCGDSYDETIAMLDHMYAKQITQEATCTADGSKTYTCSSCSHSYTEAIVALGHDYSVSVKTTAATCTAEGVTEKKCSRCDDVLKTTSSALGHNTSTGICSRCQTFISDDIEISTKSTSLAITGDTDIKFTIPGTDFTVICDYDSSYIDISWGEFVGDDIVLTVKPIKSGTTTIKVYLEEDPSVYKDVSIKITLLSSAGTTVPGTSTDVNSRDYVLNTNTKKFHYPSCKSVNQMKESNKRYYTGTRESVISMGYDPCGNCHP